MKNFLLFIFVFLYYCGISCGETDAVFRIGNFSSETEGNHMPKDWKLITFFGIPKTTSYSLVKEGGAVVLKSESKAGATGLVRSLHIDPKTYPVVEWQWKTMGTLEKSNLYSRRGDDCSARLFILFGERASSPKETLNYVWAHQIPVGTILPSPYDSRVKLIVLENDQSKFNVWTKERRNVYQDYQKAFEKKPPMICGMGIMTDTDNTKESVTTYYGDVTLLRSQDI